MTQTKQLRSDHAATYESGLASWIHKNRLKHLTDVLDMLDLDPSGELCDLGCSDGFILSQLRDLPALGSWSFNGFDNKQHHIDAAVRRPIGNTEFGIADLNLPTTELHGRFDLVLCLETLEHVGSFRSGLKNVLKAGRPGAHVVISVPNETGPAGLVKYLGRRLTRHNPYGDFFKTRSEREYVIDLVRGRPLDLYRQPERWGWGPHLGFDLHVFEQHLTDTYVGDHCDLIERRKTGVLGFNVFYVLKVH